jgi:hypothetical protein
MLNNNKSIIDEFIMYKISLLIISISFKNHKNKTKLLNVYDAHKIVFINILKGNRGMSLYKL